MVEQPQHSDAVGQQDDASYQQGGVRSQTSPGDGRINNFVHIFSNIKTNKISKFR